MEKRQNHETETDWEWKRDSLTRLKRSDIGKETVSRDWNRLRVVKGLSREIETGWKWRKEQSHETETNWEWKRGLLMRLKRTESGKETASWDWNILIVEKRQSNDTETRESGKATVSRDWNGLRGEKKQSHKTETDWEWKRDSLMWLKRTESGKETFLRDWTGLRLEKRQSHETETGWEW